jgi:hypothetical protein
LQTTRLPQQQSRHRHHGSRRRHLLGRYLGLVG